MRRLIGHTVLVGMCLAGHLNGGALEAQEADPLLSLDSLLSVPVSAAAKYDQTAREAAASVTVITAEEIQRFGYENLMEALSHIRGFYGSYDRNYHYIGVRGFGRPTDYNNRILLLLDGHTLNDNIYDGAVVGTDMNVDLDAVERIEVVRGPGSALYGSRAMLAVVNVVTRKGRDVQGAELAGEVGSFGLRRANGQFGGELANGVDVFASGHWSDTSGRDLYFSEYDDPLSNGGIAEELDWERYMGGYAAVRGGPVTFTASAHRREKGVPTGAWETLFNDPAHWTIDDRAFAEVRVDHDLGFDKELTVRGYYDMYSSDGSYPYEEPGGIWEEANDGRWAGAEARFHWSSDAGNQFSAGAEFVRNLRSDYRSWDEVEVYFENDLPFTQLSAFAQNEYQARENLALIVGGRLDHYSHVGGAFSPRAAVVYHPGANTTLKALYGTAFRAPNTLELAYEDEYFTPNPDLEPERIRTAELIIEQRLAEGLWGTLSAFDFRMSDLIDQEWDEEEENARYANVSQTHARGAEAELQAHLGLGLRGRLSYGFYHARDEDTDEQLTNSPEHLLQAGLRMPVATGVFASTDLVYESGRKTVHETMTDGHLLANVKLSTRRLMDRYQVSVAVRNLFDNEYTLPGGWEHEQESIVQDGRNVLVSVRAAF